MNLQFSDDPKICFVECSLCILRALIISQRGIQHLDKHTWSLKNHINYSNVINSMCSNRFTWLSADITILPCTFLISLERNIQMCTTYGRFDLPDMGGGVIIKSLFCCLIFHNVLKCVQFLII